MRVRQHIAAIRFGLGPRLGEALPADPDAWLASQLARPVAMPEGPGLAEALRAQYDAQQLDIARRRAAANGATSLRDLGTNPVPRLANRQSVAWVERRLRSDEPLMDRLVDFWANHFTASRRRAVVGALPFALELDAIRPHVMGRFGDMLAAVSRHPAMLRYLDNVRSTGPASRAGQRTGRGLNENLAREILELHTLSPAGGYTQGDVQELAKILTGWTVVIDAQGTGFAWQPDMHEPGPKTLLGHRIAEGPAGQDAALAMLATHPATARHVALKLARHFVADEPPASAVTALEAEFLRTGGDLGAVHRRLIALPEAWDPPLSKFRQPKDFVLAIGRAVGIGDAMPLLSGMRALDQPLWYAPQPIGWPDRAEDWAGPEALMRRTDWVYTFAAGLGRGDPRAAAEAALGPLARAETVSAIRGAGSMRDALTLLFCSPEFMHR